MNLPNKISLSRIILIPFFMAAYMLGAVLGDYWIYIATGIFALASFTDFLDGHIARKRDIVTDVGNFLDTVADKMLVIAALTVIAGYALVPVVAGVIITAVIIGRELTVLALKMMASVKNVVITADKLGKIKTVTQLIAIVIILPAKPLDAAIGSEITVQGVGTGILSITGFALLAVSALLALVSAANYFIKNRKVFTETADKAQQ